MLHSTHSSWSAGGGRYMTLTAAATPYAPLGSTLHPHYWLLLYVNWSGILAAAAPPRYHSSSTGVGTTVATYDEFASPRGRIRRPPAVAGTPNLLPLPSQARTKETIHIPATTEAAPVARTPRFGQQRLTLTRSVSDTPQYGAKHSVLCCGQWAAGGVIAAVYHYSASHIARQCWRIFTCRQSNPPVSCHTTRRRPHQPPQHHNHHHQQVISHPSLPTRKVSHLQPTSLHCRGTTRSLFHTEEGQSQAHTSRHAAGGQVSTDH